MTTPETPQSQARTRDLSDLFGLLTSGLCLIHCLLPIGLVLLASGSFAEAHNDPDELIIHSLAMLGALAACIWSFGYANASLVSWKHWATGGAGLTLLALGLWEELITVPGAFLLIGTHLDVMRRHRAHGHEPLV